MHCILMLKHLWGDTAPLKYIETFPAANAQNCCPKPFLEGKHASCGLGIPEVISTGSDFTIQHEHLGNFARTGTGYKIRAG